MRKNPKVDLKIKTKKMLELATVAALALNVILFLVYSKFDIDSGDASRATVLVKVDEIEQTQQIKRPPSPTIPSVPVESEDESKVDVTEKDDTDDTKSDEVNESEENEVTVSFGDESEPEEEDDKLTRRTVKRLRKSEKVPN